MVVIEGPKPRTKFRNRWILIASLVILVVAGATAFGAWWTYESAEFSGWGTHERVDLSCDALQNPPAGASSDENVLASAERTQNPFAIECTYSMADGSHEIQRTVFQEETDVFQSGRTVFGYALIALGAGFVVLIIWVGTLFASKRRS